MSSRPCPKSADFFSLNELASAELEQLAEDCSSTSSSSSSSEFNKFNTTNGGSGVGGGVNNRQPFPVACRALLQELDGNKKCLDCGRKNPEWAALSYGALVCLYCSGNHRSLGVNVSTVRSITMDHWNYMEVVKMLEGGNRQLSSFFHRHNLTSDTISNSSMIPSNKSSGAKATATLTVENCHKQRYKTKAAQFYRNHLEHHVTSLLSQGTYKGRKQRKKCRPLSRQASTDIEC